MATTTCLKPVRGRMMRATKLDSCGRPVAGPANQVTSSGFVTVTYSMEVEDGDEISVKNAAGELCISDKACDQLKWVTTAIALCEVDPDLFAIMNPTWSTELGADGNSVGFRIASKMSCDTGFALEVWTDLIGSDVCADPDATGSWGYVLLPWVVGGAPGDIEIGNDAISFTLNGRTKVNSRWGVGPYDVVRDSAGQPAPLAVAIGPDTPMLFRATTVPPPEGACGAGIVPPMTNKLTLTAQQSVSDPMTYDFAAVNATGETVTFDFGDGSDTVDKTTVANAAAAEHTYTEAGAFTASATDGTDTAQTSVDPTTAEG